MTILSGDRVFLVFAAYLDAVASAKAKVEKVDVVVVLCANIENAISALL